ncbi:ATP synthase F1 subunit epsilon [Mycoplasmopsis edwardii]|nr:ATP synthase F1 subunit epsilon [Mycoplasmopsis edwardii]
MKNTTHLIITVPSGIYYEGDVEIVTLKTATGYMGIQPNISPIFSSIEIGTLTIGWNNSDNSEKYYIGGGLVYAENKKINIITDDIIKVSEIDILRAQKEKEELEKIISQSNKDNVDITKLETKLKKTLYRIESYNFMNNK